MQSNVEKADIFIFLGLVLTGAGLFLWFGIGPALAITGALLFLMGFFSGAREIKR